MSGSSQRVVVTRDEKRKCSIWVAPQDGDIAGHFGAEQYTEFDLGYVDTAVLAKFAAIQQSTEQEDEGLMDVFEKLINIDRPAARQRQKKAA